MSEPLSFTIVQDTREPCAEHDPPDALFAPSVYHGGALWAVDVAREKLDVGDYSLPGLAHLVAIERKTLPDLIGSIVGSATDALGKARSNRDRFVAELDRMRPLAFKRIVVEASIADVYSYAQGKRWNPASVIASLLAFDVDYGVATIWAANRGGAEVWVGETLSRIWSQHIGGEAWRKAEARGYAAELAWGPPEELTRYRKAV